MSSPKALEDAIRTGQAAMENLIAQQKQAAIDECDELFAANIRQQKRLVKSLTTASLTDTPVGSVQSLVVGILSRFNSAKCEKLNKGFENIIVVEQTLNALLGEHSEARARLLYNLLSSWKEDPMPEIVAAVEKLRRILDCTNDSTVHTKPSCGPCQYDLFRRHQLMHANRGRIDRFEQCKGTDAGRTANNASNVSTMIYDWSIGS